MYKRIASIREAQLVLDAINRCLGESRYAEPIPHPTREDALIIFRPEILGECQSYLAAYPTLSDEQVVSEGWYLGPFPGRFGKSRAKLEEAQHLFDYLSDPVTRDNRPVFRSLFFAYLATLYSLKESIQKVCAARDWELKAWWLYRKKELEAKGELLEYLIRIGNRDKHNHENYLRYPARIYGIQMSNTLPPGWPAGNYRLVMSGEGNFALMDEGKKTFRRIPLGLGSGLYVTELIGVPGKHLGTPIGESNIVTLCRLAKEYFEDILFTAENIDSATLSQALGNNP
ncbi:hypothetical protein [Lamprocystis purpurea]|jgi:hypothetical protein|uniref:hypothetical protein n=1 Tax=Lamprocystis purpurea TaxID=61598 RepID=UPI0012F717E7|nr:hypothetical protein [Lamprocystis purpurea]MBV5347912.1 hypothetical protein [bacterium]